MLAGVLLYLAFPPVSWPVLAPVGVAVLALATYRAGVREGAVSGLLCGLGLFLPLLTWTGAVAGPAAWIALSVLEAVFFAALGAGLALTSRLPAWPLWGAAVWTLQETCRDRQPFGGFPWGRLAFSQDETVLTPLVALAGAPWLTFVVALLGGLLAALLLRPPRRTVAAGAALAVGLVALALVVPTPTDGPSVRVAIVQGNVPRSGLDAFSQRAEVLRNHVQATHELAEQVRAGVRPQPDIVIWPENASDLDPYANPKAFALIDGAVKDIGVPVLVGALVTNDQGTVDNSGIVWDPATGPGARYVKQHPVPFGEYIPLRGLLSKITDKVDLVPRDFRAGTQTGVLQVGPVLLGDVICFEVAYDGIVRETVAEGAQVVVVQTNNASFGRSAQTDQQLAMGRLRAVEHGRAVLVAATTGISAVIMPDGEILAQTDKFEREVLIEQVPMRTDLTLATRVGAWPELILSVLAIAGIGLAVRRGRLRE